jgi:uncharacterized membrane-anchored protein YjiN (DUF445 family)
MKLNAIANKLSRVLQSSSKQAPQYMATENVKVLSLTLRDLHSSDNERLRAIQGLERLIKLMDSSQRKEVLESSAPGLMQTIQSSNDEAIVKKATSLLLADLKNNDAETFIIRVLETTANDDKRSWLLALLT